MRQVTIILFSLFSILAMAQKQSVTITDFNVWKSISNTKVSENGDKLAYELKPGKGNNKLIIYDIESEKNDTFNCASDLIFRKDAQMALFKISPTLEQQRSAKKNKLSKDKSPKDTLAILIQSTDSLIKFPKVKTYKIANEGGLWASFTTEEKFSPKKDTSKHDSIKVKPPKLPKGGDNMIIFNGTTLDTMLIRNVSSFAWSENGKALVFATEKKDSTTESQICLFTPKDKSFQTFFSIEGIIKKLSINKQGSAIAWLSSKDTLDKKTFELQMTPLDKPNIILVADSNSSILPANWAPSENGNIFFSESGERLYFGSAPRPKQPQKDTLLYGEKVGVDIWSWQDLEIQPYQKVNKSREQKRTYQCVYHIKQQHLVQLCDTNYKQVRFSTKKDKTYGTTSDDSPYKRASNWNAKFITDHYLVNLEDGEKTLMIKGISRTWLSPSQKYFVYYQPQDSNYYIINIKRKTTRILNKTIPTMMVDEEHDSPSAPYSYGIAGWDESDKHVFIYDKYDIWMVDPSGKSNSINLTKGRKHFLSYRIIRLDRDKEIIDTNNPVLVSVFNHKTKSSGWTNLSINPEVRLSIVTMEPKYYGLPTKAKEADILYYTRQDCNEYPDLWICNRSMTLNKKISNANPQKEKLIWNTVELTHWQSFNGDTLEGLLYKPENFDPTKKYPMIVYFYERNSNNLHRFNSIYPSYSTINKTRYTSNGYLVFVPDIKYKIGYPGQSAYECIVSGVQHLIEHHNWIDTKKIGLQGQSWGGYQTAYLITQTNLFAAGMAGAPVSNMTSAYGGIRWQSGMSRMFQYEHTQSRIGGTLWDKPMLYIENSPLFYANKVNTPLLIMSNDNDGAVPWYQGIEYFMALRRLDKPVWLLNYNNETHNLRPASWGNRVDLSVRMMEFFNHYLKDQTAPNWMTKGVKAVDKEYMKGY